MKTALLLSGGMDSTAIAYWKRPDLLITIDYGQKPAAGEIRASRAVASYLQIEHALVTCDLSRLGSGDLAGTSALGIATVPEWWPYRNQMLLTIGSMRAVPHEVEMLMIGCIANDCVHIDGKKEFVEAIDKLFSMQEGALKISAPAIDMSALELCRRSGAPLEYLSWAHSCHKSDFACGVCRGCEKHYHTWKSLCDMPY